MGLDLTDRVPEELRTEVCGIVLEMVIKIIPKKKKCQKRQKGSTLKAKDGEALYSQQKQDRELIVAQIMNSFLPNSDLN